MLLDVPNPNLTHALSTSACFKMFALFALKSETYTFFPVSAQSILQQNGLSALMQIHIVAGCKSSILSDKSL